jgi:hypothetical protein
LPINGLEEEPYREPGGSATRRARAPKQLTVGWIGEG